jgi:hypothetical protein
MNVTPRSLCLLVAAVIFAAAALWVPSAPPRLNLVPAGLTFLALAFLLP